MKLNSKKISKLKLLKENEKKKITLVKRKARARNS
jgi:hypothetical protein